MTIPEACSLVLKTGGVGTNGESYLLDMGEPVKILEVAEQLIRFMGYEPEKDIPITFIGRRSGERLDEPLWNPDELPVPTKFPRILRLEKSGPDDTVDTTSLLRSLEPVCFLDPEQKDEYRNRRILFSRLASAIPSFRNNRHD
jgi:FlaA1/EpsC-like NDP-sugar epimerase